MPKGVSSHPADTYERKNCRFCHEPITLLQMAKHEKKCEKLTPEQRHKNTSARATYYRLKAKKRHGELPYLAPNGTPAKRPYNKTGLYAGRQAIRLNGKKGRLTVQLSVPMKVALSVIRELVPHIEIDRVGVE